MRLCSVALLCAAALPALAQSANTVDAAWILSRLAQPAPMRTDFVEVRESPLLKNPLRISGEYRRPDADTLVREVRVPYAETTTIRGGQARIERPGRAARNFALARAPQLASIEAGFGALLRGDQRGIERDFEVQVEGSRNDWRMRLNPRQEALRAQLRDITLYGRGSELRCIETRIARGGEVQRTLLASAARALAADADAARLEAACRGSRA
ncbi:LolA-related protein [Luteimonas sp. e5]